MPLSQVGLQYSYQNLYSWVGYWHYLLVINLLTYLIRLITKSLRWEHWRWTYQDCHFLQVQMNNYLYHLLFSWEYWSDSPKFRLVFCEWVKFKLLFCYSFRAQHYLFDLFGSDLFYILFYLSYHTLYLDVCIYHHDDHVDMIWIHYDNNYNLFGLCNIFGHGSFAIRLSSKQHELTLFSSVSLQHTIWTGQS